MREDAKKFVNFVCGKNWEEVSVEDKNGGYGVACMQAYINGVKPTTEDISSFLGTSKENVQYAFSQLLQSGMFSKAFNARGDASLNLKIDKKDRKNESYIRDVKCAWGHVAAIASGMIIRNYSNMNIKPI